MSMPVSSTQSLKGAGGYAFYKSYAFYKKEHTPLVEVKSTKSLREAGGYTFYKKEHGLSLRAKAMACFMPGYKKEMSGYKREMPSFMPRERDIERDILNARDFEVGILNGRVVQQDLSAGRPSDKEHGA